VASPPVAGQVTGGQVQSTWQLPGQAVSSVPSHCSVPSRTLLPQVCAAGQVQLAVQLPGQAVSSVPSNCSDPSLTLLPQTAPPPAHVPAAASLTRNLLPSPVPLKVMQ